MNYKSILLSLSAMSLISTSAQAAEVIYSFKGVVTAREGRGMNSVPASFASTDPAIGDAFDLTVRFAITAATGTSSYSFGSNATYVSPASTSLRIGSWSLDQQQATLFKSRVEINDNVSALAPPNNTLYYPADRFSFGLMAEYFSSGSYACPDGLFSGVSNMCYQTHIGTGAQDITGKTLDSPLLSTFDISTFAPSEISLSFLDFNSNYRKVTISTLSQNTEFIDAVPEPASWIMMLVGFGGIGFGMRRRNYRVTTNIA